MTDFTLDQLRQIDNDILDALNQIASRYQLDTQDFTLRLISILSIWTLANAPLHTTAATQLAHLLSIQRTIFLSYAQQMRTDQPIM